MTDWLNKNAKRLSIMSRMYRDGKTLAEIGEHFGVTREAIRQHLKRAGLSRKDGGQHVRTKRARAKARRVKECEFIRRWGCTRAEYRAIRGDLPYWESPIGAYIRQKVNARGRGIAWEFNLPSWWKVWQESGRWEQRGRGNGYVMARNGDTGPYSPDNVHIVHAVENITEYYEREFGTDCSGTLEKWGLTDA